MNLFEKQKLFPSLLASFICELEARGYGITFGEMWRPPETAALYAKEGKGITHSLHTLRLAIDLNLFRDGKYLTRTEEYLEAGELWEGYSTTRYTCCWGGRFRDGNHFSIEHAGTR